MKGEVFKDPENPSAYFTERDIPPRHVQFGSSALLLESNEMNSSKQPVEQARRDPGERRPAADVDPARESAGTHRPLAGHGVIPRAASGVAQFIADSPRLAAQQRFRADLFPPGTSLGERGREPLVGRDSRPGLQNGYRSSASPSAPVQRVRIGGEENRGAFLPPKSPEEKAAFLQRMAREMAELRETMKRKEEQVDARSPDDIVDVPQRLLSSRPQDRKDWLKHPMRREFDRAKRERVEDRLKARTYEPPTVAVSNRPGLGYDQYALQGGRTAMTAVSAPPGFRPLPKNASPEEKEAEQRRVQRARDPDRVADHLARASGLFLPGGQDRVSADHPEWRNRDNYERSLVAAARLRGMPTLAVCGGSRSLARAFGGHEETLDDALIKVHQKESLDARAHGLLLPASHSILGGAAPDIRSRDQKSAGVWPEGSRRSDIDAVNSTHEKVVRRGEDGELDVPKLPATDEKELMISATDPHGHPEGFETPYGAPIVGVTSHPEAIYGTSAWHKATRQAQEWSSNIFKGFAQSMIAYREKQEVHRQLLRHRKRE